MKDSSRSPVAPAGTISNLSAEPQRLKERRGAVLACARRSFVVLRERDQTTGWMITSPET